MSRPGRGPAVALALASIRAYQRFLSPYKGYCCAYRSRTGALSCSQYGQRAISRHGVLLGLRLLGRRLDACAAQGRLAKPAARGPLARPSLQAQAGHCDVPDLSCSTGDACNLAGDGLDCLDCASNLPDRCLPGFGPARTRAPENSASAALRARVEAAKRRGRDAAG